MDTVYKEIEYKINLLAQNVQPCNQKEVRDIWTDFNMIYTNIVHNNKTRDQLIEDMTNLNIFDKMERLSETITSSYVLQQYNIIPVPTATKVLKLHLCDYCNEEMIQSYDKTTYDCIICNISKPVENTLIDTTKSVPRSRIGNFNPERHFRTWMDRIYAKESEDEIRSNKVGDINAIIKLIRDSLCSKSKSIEHITIDDIRLILKELDLTSLNKNTSLIAKKITGKSPPIITDEQYMQVHGIFNLVMESRDRVNTISKCNRIYYPYYISKILDLIIKDPNQRRILNYIHLHKETTLTDNDMEWLEICNIVPLLKGKYRPTVPSTNRYI